MEPEIAYSDKSDKNSDEENDVRIVLWKSAPSQSKPIPRIHDLIDHWLDADIESVVDIGCGRLRNALVLVKEFNLWISDFQDLIDRLDDRLETLKKSNNFQGYIPPSDLKNCDHSIDAAFLSFVLHTIPEVDMRKQLVRSTEKILKDASQIFIAVPYGELYYRKRMTKENQFKDGYLFNTGYDECTFYREYSSSQIDEFMDSLGYEVDEVFGADKKRMRTYIKS